MLRRIAVASALIILCAASILRVARPPSAVPANAPDTTFSAERALVHVKQIAQRPHPMGSADHDRVRDYIQRQLLAVGLPAQIQHTTAIGTRYQQVGRVQNILARVPGKEPNGKAVLVMVHYDGVEAGPAASDDGAGSAALLEMLRALRSSKRPLTHDVIALFTDGEESGLLGSAAFVREHPWAKDVAVVLNFEARGTTGRSFMFETGPGNLDAARALRSAGNATAGSVYATIYRALPNDTDLSELAVLRLPALNFAFADGVERYHTSRDDVAHLNPGSLQHHGSQMLAMTRTFANGQLPRPRTGDAVFFEMPVVGLLVYPQSLELVLAIVALVLVVVLVVRDRRGVSAGFLAAIVALVLSAVVAWIVGGRLGGPAVWSGLFAVAIVLLALAATALCVAIARKWSTPRGLHIGAMIVWLILSLAVSLKSPGVGYLFTWPLIFAAGAELLTRGREPARWIAVFVALFMLAGFIYGVSVVMLGLTGTGGIALAVVASLIALLVLPQLEIVAGTTRWAMPISLAVAGLAILVIGWLTVHPTADHPLRSALVYAEDASSGDAWFGTLGRVPNDWTRQVLGHGATTGSAWITSLSGNGGRFTGRRIQRVQLPAPSATLVSDSAVGSLRKLRLRLTAPVGTTALRMRASGAEVVASSIDGRAVDTTRYRSRTHDWVMEYWAVPDTGATIELTIPAGKHIGFELAARQSGLPSLSGMSIPPRPSYVVPSQTGDISVVYRQWRF